jgi:putative DNA primase/helicase
LERIGTGVRFNDIYFRYGHHALRAAAPWRGGVYLHAIDERTNQFIDLWILSVLRVIAVTRTYVGKEHGYLLEFVPHGETALRREIMPQSLLVSRGDEFMMSLRSWGVSALFENRNEIRDYLDQEHKKFSAQKPENFWMAVKVVGWHTSSAFVLPDRVIGDQDGIWFQGSGEGAQYASNGTLEDWKNQVAIYALNNPYLLFAICCGFSGPLLNLLNVIGIGFHFLGAL